jgi:hypothetical protein
VRGWGTGRIGWDMRWGATSGAGRTRGWADASYLVNRIAMKNQVREPIRVTGVAWSVTINSKGNVC